MDLITINIDEYEPHPKNYNTHPTDQLTELERSLEKFDQFKNVVVWNGFYLAGHGLVESARRAGRATLKAVDMSHLSEEDARALMVADNRLPELAEIDNDLLKDLIADFPDPTEIPGVDNKFVAELHLPPKEPPETPVFIDKAEILKDKWGCEEGQIWAMESKSRPGTFHRLMCGDCRNPDHMLKLTDGQPVNGVFTSPPYAQQRKAQYGGVPVDEYVDWWDKVQENVRRVLAQDGSFFVNIKPHRTKKQRVLYVMDLVLTMVRKWGWWYIDELSWTHQGLPQIPLPGFKNQFEPIHQFSQEESPPIHRDNVSQPIIQNKARPKPAQAPPPEARFENRHEPIHHFTQNGDFKRNYDEVRKPGSEGHYKTIEAVKAGYTSPGVSSGFDSARTQKYYDVNTTTVYPGNVININLGSIGSSLHAAVFPTKLATFFIKAYSTPGQIWLDPFAGSGTVIIAAENELRLGYGMEMLPKYVAVTLQRYQDHTGITPQLMTK